MGVKAPAADRRAPDRRRARSRPSRPRWSSAARCPASAPSSRRSTSIAAAVERGGHQAARRSPSSARSRPGASGSPGSSGRPLHGRRVVVTRARAQASGLAATPRRARRRGRRAAGDPDRAADRQRRGAPRGREPPRLRARLPDQPERRPTCCSRRWPPQGRDARALAGATRRRDRRRAPRRRSPRTAIVADIVPERFVAEALVEALAELRGRGQAGARRPRRRGARRPPRRARASAAPRSTSSPSTRRSPRSPTRGRSSAPADADYVTFTSSSTVRNLIEAIGDGASPRAPASSRSARSPARPPARPASRSTSRPSATTSTAWSTRCSARLPSRIGDWIRPWRRRGRSPSSPTTATRTSSPASAAP